MKMCSSARSAHLKIAVGVAAHGRQVRVRDVCKLELRDGLRELVDLVGDALRRRLAAVVVELDAEVLLGAAWKGMFGRMCVAASPRRGVVKDRNESRSAAEHADT